MKYDVMYAAFDSLDTPKRTIKKYEYKAQLNSEQATEHVTKLLETAEKGAAIIVFVDYPEDDENARLASVTPQDLL